MNFLQLFRKPFFQPTILNNRKIVANPWSVQYISKVSFNQSSKVDQSTKLDLRTVLHIKNLVVHHKKPFLVVNQVRTLKYSNFGHGHEPTPLLSTIWYKFLHHFWV